MMAKKIDKQNAFERINEAISNGTAAEKFDQMIYSLGGPTDFIEKYDSHLMSSSYVGEIKANKSGSIQSIQTKKLGLILIELGGGRKQISDKINYTVGYENVISVGENVDTSTPLLKVHSESKDDFNKIKNQIHECFTISNNKSDNLDIIYETIN